MTIYLAAGSASRTWTPTEEDPTGLTRFTYGDGDSGTEIIFYRVGLTSQHVDASEMIWMHLKDHQLPE